MTDDEKIRRVEARLNGHTQPPHELWYIGGPRFSKVNFTYCKNDTESFAPSIEGICRLCYEKQHDR
jgi:hypothetical protein